MNADAADAGHPAAPAWIDAARVHELLTYERCISAMRDALRAFSTGAAAQPVRAVIPLPGDAGHLYVMPASLPGPDAVAVKLLTVVEGNAARGRPTHQGVLVVFDAATGEVRALVDAAPVTAIRTAAVSAVATGLLARPDARTLALLGSGVQAASHLRALRTVRTFERVVVWSRHAMHAHAFSDAHGAYGPVVVAASAEAAVREADVVCTVTSSPVPVLHGEWLRAGTHVTAVGASLPATRELDARAVARARVYVDSRAAAAAEAGDLLIARAESAIDEAHIIGELGELIDGRIAGRTADDEITLFKSLGLAVEDAAAAALIVSGQS
jgi:alanine dehydrogenase